MSYTTTTNYNLTKPDPGTESDNWGLEINANTDVVDALLKTLDTRVATLEASQTSLTWQ